MFFFTTIITAFFPLQLVTIVNQLSQWLHWPGSELSLGGDQLWHVPAVALQVMLMIIASRAIKELGHSLLLVRLIVVTEWIVASGYGVMFILSAYCFVYLCAAFLSAAIAVLTQSYYRQVVALKGSQ